MLNKRTEKISVIVPVYNVELYMKKCIESLIGQTYPNLEILLVDDGSTDATGQICDRYAEKDNRIQVLHKENGGLSDARNYGIDRARGSLLAFVDGDDWIHPQMYELMSGVMECQNADVVTCQFEQRNADFAKQRYRLEQVNLKVLNGTEALSEIEIPLVVAWNKLYKKEIFDNIRYPKGKLHEDEYVIHKIFYQCRKVAVMDKPLYFYTIRHDSIVAHMTAKRIEDSLEAFEDRVSFADSMSWAEVMPAVVRRYCDYCIDRYQELKDGNYEFAADEYLNILWHAERDMLRRYSDIEIDKKYQIFAESPTKYIKWVAAAAKRSRYRGMPRQALDKLAKLFCKNSMCGDRYGKQGR